MFRCVFSQRHHDFQAASPERGTVYPDCNSPANWDCSDGLQLCRGCSAMYPHVHTHTLARTKCMFRVGGANLSYPPTEVFGKWGLLLLLSLLDYWLPPYSHVVLLSGHCSPSDGSFPEPYGLDLCVSRIYFISLLTCKKIFCLIISKGFAMKGLHFMLFLFLEVMAFYLFTQKGLNRM